MHNMSLLSDQNDRKGSRIRGMMKRRHPAWGIGNRGTMKGSYHRMPLFFWLLLFLLTGCSLGGGSSTPATSQTQKPGSSSFQCSSHSSNPVMLTMYYGSEKKDWIDDVVADFNSRHITACDGPITIKATPVGSGQSMQQIANGTIQPDIWSPAGSTWLTLLNDQWQKKYHSDIVPTGANSTPSLVLSPVVIAMWKPEAEALGWPNRPIGWAKIAALSTDPQGWASYGHPEWGDFKFGHTRPDDSNSGLDSVIAEHYAAVGKVRGLTIDDVNSKTTQDFVANVESSIIHYGDSTGFFADEMFTKGPNYLSAAVMYESLVVEANEGKKYPHLPYPVVAIYPVEGTFYSDHPFVIPQANWITPAKKTSALAFRDFLLDPHQQTKALQYGFRPANSNIAAGAPIDSNHGVDPRQPQSILQVPSADVIQAIQSSWEQQRRKVDVMLILDRSGSMNDNGKIGAAKGGLKEFVQLLGPSDGLGLTIFSDDQTVITPVTPLGPKEQSLLKAIDQITANGKTRLYNTIADQVKAMQSLQSKHIKVVIVLTDGMDTVNQLTVDQLVNQIMASGANAGEAVKVYTIAYGQDADKNALTKIADATGGQEYAGTPENIKQVYLDISRFF